MPKRRPEQVVVVPAFRHYRHLWTRQDDNVLHSWLLRLLNTRCLKIMGRVPLEQPVFRGQAYVYCSRIIFRVSELHNLATTFLRGCRFVLSLVRGGIYYALGPEQFLMSALFHPSCRLSNLSSERFFFSARTLNISACCVSVACVILLLLLNARCSYQAADRPWNKTNG